MNATTISPTRRWFPAATPSSCRGSRRANTHASSPPSSQVPICSAWWATPEAPNAMAAVTAAVAEPVGDQCQPHWIHTGRKIGSAAKAAGQTTVRQRAAAMMNPFQPNNASSAVVSSSAINTVITNHRAAAQPTCVAMTNPARPTRTATDSLACRWNRRAADPTPTVTSAADKKPTTSATRCEDHRGLAVRRCVTHAHHEGPALQCLCGPQSAHERCDHPFVAARGHHQDVFSLAQIDDQDGQ